LQPDRREGFVFAANSDRGQILVPIVFSIWARASLGAEVPYSVNDSNPAGVLVGLCVVIATALLGWATIDAVRIRRRMRSRQTLARVGLTLAAAGRTAALLLFAALWLYGFHSDLPLPLPTAFPDVIWPREVILVTVAVLVRVVVGLASTFLPKEGAASRRPQHFLAP
jgi:hypothetical protein